MDYEKINKIETDGNGNIILQDINGKDITINYNDTDKFGELISLANEKLLSQIQEMITKQENKNKIKGSDVKETINNIKLKRLKKEIIDLDELISEWREQLSIANTPSERKRCNMEIERLENLREKAETEL